MSTKDMKKQERGSIDSVVDESNKISLIRWADKAVGTVASNIHSTNPTVKASRWSSKMQENYSGESALCDKCLQMSLWEVLIEWIRM